MRCTAIIPIAEITIRIEPTAATAGLISPLTPLQINTGRVRNEGVVRKIATTTSSHEAMNAKIAPAITPGKIKGSVTRQKVRQGPAPRPALANSKFGLRVWSVAVTEATTNGVESTVLAATRPTSVPTRRQLENTMNMPIASTMTGVTNGLKSSARTVALPAKWLRNSASAAEVPRTTEKITVRHEVLKLVIVALCQAGSMRTLSYHLSE